MPVFEERLRQLGSWLNINGEAIYGTRSWKYQNDTYNPDVWYTKKGRLNSKFIMIIIKSIIF